MRVLDSISLILLSGAMAWAVYLAFPNTWGIIIAILIISFAIIHLFLQRSSQKKSPVFRIRTPALCYLILAIIGVLLVIFEEKSQLTLLYYLLALSGVIGIIGWFARGEYRKPIKQIWNDDLFILPAEADLVLVLILLYDKLVRHESFSWVTYLIIIIAVLDIFNQFYKRIKSGTKKEE